MLLNLFGELLCALQLVHDGLNFLALGQEFCVRLCPWSPPEFNRSIGTETQSHWLCGARLSEWFFRVESPLRLARDSAGALPSPTRGTLVVKPPA